MRHHTAPFKVLRPFTCWPIEDSSRDYLLTKCVMQHVRLSAPHQMQVVRCPSYANVLCEFIGACISLHKIGNKIHAN